MQLFRYSWRRTEAVLTALLVISIATAAVLTLKRGQSVVSRLPRVPPRAEAPAQSGESTVPPSPPREIQRSPQGKPSRRRTVIAEGQMLAGAHGGRLLHLRLPTLPGVEEQRFPISLAEHPEWIVKGGKAVSAFLEDFLRQQVAPLLPVPYTARILALPEEGKLQATLEGRAQEGWMIRSDAAAAIAQALAKGLLTVTIPLEYVPAIIVNETDTDLGSLTLLARGRSNFAGSVPNRAFNARKALNEHVNGVLLAPGATFSFGGIFREPISSKAGWKMAMGIFDGSRLEATPGGGICQSSTTLYRAALLVGLPILEHYSHSLYIKFYSEHGEGLDATYYPGSKDLKFLNDTGNPLLLQAYDEGGEAIVEIYGTPDGRSISLEGPYRASDAPQELTEQLGRALYANEIAWQYRVTSNEGAVQEQILRARYANTIPAESTSSVGLPIPIY